MCRHPSRRRGSHAVLVFGQQVAPTHLLMTDVGLLLQPLQAGIVGVQLEKVGSQSLERVHHRQQLEQVLWVRAP